MIIDEVKKLGFMDSGTGQHQSNTVYDENAVCPNITTINGGGTQQIKVLTDAQAVRMVRTEEGKALRKQYENHELHHGFNEHREMELREDGISNTLSTVQKDNYICEKSIVAMRGRNPDNPSDRTVGSPTEQRLEPNSQGICNTLTSVQKDNLVLENNPIGSLYYSASEQFGCGYMDNCYKTVKAEKDDLGVVKSVKIKQATKDGYIECKVGEVADLSFPSSTTRRGRVQDNGDTCPTLMAGEQDICRIESVCAIDEQNMNVRQETFGTLTTDGSSPKHNNRVMEIKKVGQISSDGSQYGTVIDDSGLCSTLSAGTHGYANSCISNQYRIRKLTPMECWRLMDFSDEDFLSSKLGSREVAKEILKEYPHLGKIAFTEVQRLEKMSNTQLYKQAGNSICRNVLVAIFGQMLPGKENVYKEVNEC